MGRRQTYRPRLYLTVLTAVFFLLAPGAAQRPLQHEVTVALKLIQVFVTGPGGKPVLDLGKEDFALTDNDRPQTITDFESHVLAGPAARPAVAVQPAPAEARAEESGRTLLNRKFIFLIDYVTNNLEGVGKAKAAALKFLETQVGPDDEVGLFSLSPTSGLTLHEYLTKDHDRVRTRLKRLRGLVGVGATTTDAEMVGMQLLNADVMAPHTRYGDHAGPTSRDLLVDIAAWARSLRTIPGRKNIILFTRGFGSGVVRPGSLNNVLFETMARELATANAPVFTVDTTPQVAPTGTGPAPSMTLTEGSLDYLAKATGGKFMGHVNYSARVAAGIQDATANYYVLGYYVPAAWDGKYHEVEVEVRRPGCQVHAQRGYFDPVAFAKMSRLEKHLHLVEAALGDPGSGTSDTRFPMTAVPYAAGTAADVILIAGLDVPSVRNAVGDKTELVRLVLDEDRSIVEGKRAEVDWRDFPAEAVYQYGLTALPPGRYECRLVVRNLEDGRTAVGACAVDVAVPSSEGPAMFPPLLQVRRPDAKYLRLSMEQDKSVAEGPSISEIFPFLGKDDVPLVGPLERDATEIRATLRCVWRGLRGGQIDLECGLVAEGGEGRVPLPAEIVDQTSRADTDLYYLRFELPALAPGRYRLEIVARPEGPGTTVTASTGFAVR